MISSCCGDLDVLYVLTIVLYIIRILRVVIVLVLLTFLVGQLTSRPWPVNEVPPVSVVTQ